MASKVYFGTATKQSWIKAPLSGMKAGSQGWATETQLLNGRLHLQSSQASHRRYEASWVGDINDTDLELSLSTIRDFSSGLYGQGPFYFVDPFASNQNILPQNWAAPMLTEYDWPNIADITPGFFDSTLLTNNYPVRYAEYDMDAAYESTVKLTLIIPPGFRLHFGWHGTVASASTGVRITPYLRSTGLADADLNPSKITAGGSLRTNTAINGNTYSRVEIFLASTLDATVQICGMIAQILPDTDSVESGGFISGRGTTGLQFAQKPQIEYYSSAVNKGQIGMSASWVEVD
jgi:hypothetical protein